MVPASYPNASPECYDWVGVTGVTADAVQASRSNHYRDTSSLKWRKHA